MINPVYMMSLLEGLVATITLSLLTFLFGGMLGAVLALVRISPLKSVRTLSAVFVSIVQGIPLLVLMGVAFFGPSLLGLDVVEPLTAATLAMTIYASVYLAEIWRGCLEAVPRAQWEAAECLGLTRTQRMTRVIAPQALKIALPPTVGFMVQIIKNTSIASLVVGYGELTYNTKLVNNSTFQPFLYFGLAGLLYFSACYPLSELSRYLERKLDVEHR